MHLCVKVQRFEPTTSSYKSNALSTRPRLPRHHLWMAASHNYSAVVCCKSVCCNMNASNWLSLETPFFLGSHHLGVFLSWYSLCSITMLSFLICLLPFFIKICLFIIRLSVGWVQAVVSREDSDNAGPWEGPLWKPGLSSRLPSGQWPRPQPLWLRPWENHQESRGPACAGIIRIKSIPSFPYSSILHFHKFRCFQTM